MFIYQWNDAIKTALLQICQSTNKDWGVLARGWFVDCYLVDRPTGRLGQLVDRVKTWQLVDDNSLTANWSKGENFLSTGQLDNWSTSYIILYKLSTGRPILKFYINGQLVDSNNWSTGQHLHAEYELSKSGVRFALAALV